MMKIDGRYYLGHLEGAGKVWFSDLWKVLPSVLLFVTNNDDLMFEFDLTYVID